MSEQKSQNSKSPRSKEIPKVGVSEKLEKLADEAETVEQESGSQFMRPEPPKRGRGRPKGSTTKEEPLRAQPSQDEAIKAFYPLSAGVVETLSSFCVRLAEDDRASIKDPHRSMMVQSGAVCGYYFIGEGSEKWVALGTFLLLGTQAFANAYSLRMQNLQMLHEEKKRRDAAQNSPQPNGQTGPSQPVQ